MVSDKRDRKRVSLHTLGCRLNQSETNIIKDKLMASGYEIVAFGEEADLAIINTCTVTREADSKCRQAIRMFMRKNPKAYTVVVGCYSQMNAKELAEMGGIDLIIGNQDKLNVMDYIDEKLEKNAVPVIVRERMDRDDFTIQFVGDAPFNWRANLKIQDGCDFMCSYCRIPFARGRARSREFENLMDEARSMVDRGVRELVLTGVNIGTYRNQGKGIVEVVDALNEIEGLDRIRISSIEPTTIPEGLLDRMNDKGHALMPLLHIPLQAGSDKVLKAMRRKYALKEFLDFIDWAAGKVEDICIGTDIMVGFPGEGEEEFEQTCRVLMEHPFAYCHVFTYSEREETLAAKKEEQVAVKERQQRSVRLRRLSAKKRHDYHESFIGKEMEVLFEDPREGVWPGYTNNYIRVVAKHEEDLRNRFGLVRMDRVVADYVEGTVVKVIG